MDKCEICSKKAEPVPFVAFESITTKLETANRRLWILLLVLVVLLFGSNAAWIYYESQWQVVQETEIEQDTDGGGNNYIVGGDFNGEAKGQSDEAENP